MQKIKLTKMQIVADDRFPPTSQGQTMPGESWEGEESPITPKPIIGRPFFISTYKTSLVQEIISENMFKTMNSIYKWEKIK